jgi:opacity protein-like surface antigen
MKAMFLTAALLAAATTASAGELTGEARFADPRSSVKGSTEAVLTYNGDVPAAYASYVYTPNAFVTGLTWGAEASSLQPEHSGAVNTKLDVHVGAKLANVNGVSIVPAVEVGQNFQQGHDTTFWGLSATASYPVTSKISVDTGFRYRQSLRDVTAINEDRFNAGVSYAVAKNTAVGLEYYRTTGTLHSDAVGVKVVRNF